ncbi:MAG: response regulator, partial [Hyphomicrobiales bacterium]
FARPFARALGGDITVTSELGKGTPFSVTLTTGPLEDIRLLQADQLPTEDEQLSDVDNVQWEFPAARILVVDDGEQNRDLTTLVLEEAGLSVDQAENGQIAVDKTSTVAYDVILMDVQMPVMDGFTAVRTMREKGLEAPVIALTANAMKGFEAECLEAGYTGYMTKPINIDGLIRKLAELLGAQRCQPQHGDEKEPELKVPDPAQPRLLAVAAVVQAPGDAGTPTRVSERIQSRLANSVRLHPVIRRFVENLPEQIDALATALGQGDHETLQQLAHKIKGTAGMVGYDALSPPAARLEEFARARQLDDAAPFIDEIRLLADAVVAPGDETLYTDNTAVTPKNSASGAGQ